MLYDMAMDMKKVVSCVLKLFSTGPMRLGQVLVQQEQYRKLFFFSFSHISHSRTDCAVLLHFYMAELESLHFKHKTWFSSEL